MIRMPGRSYSGSFVPLSDVELEVSARLHASVQVLAGDIGERNVFRYEALEAAARYIEETFQQQGYKVSCQSFALDGRPVRNIEAILGGTNRPEEVVVVGAHYDSVFGSPGANDNASGTAALLELGRLLEGCSLARTVKLVGFVNEEPPFFRTQYMGSRVYARQARRQGHKIIAMLSLETLGYYSTTQGSQKYPFPFGFFYPGTGSFIGFVGNTASRALVRKCISSFRSHAAFPSEGLAAPGWIVGVGWSDHWAFWQEGFPAVMITDTALFRYAQYHRPEDTPDKLEYRSAARVVVGLKSVVCDLAGLGSSTEA